MSRVEYPRVHPPFSQQPQQQYFSGSAGEPDPRPYSWVNSAREPDDGRFKRDTARQSKIPPLPQIPDHLNPHLQTANPASPPPIDGTPVPVYTRLPDSNTTNPQQIAAAVSHNPRQATNATDQDPRQPNHRSTPSNSAPEFIKYEYPTQQSKPITIAPDVHALSPTRTNFSQSRTNTTNFPVVAPTSNIPAQFIPNISDQNQHYDSNGGTWRHALCSCADTSTCLTGLFCPCILYGKTQHRLTLRSEKKDPTNMLGYSAFNGSCAVFALLCGCNWILAAIQHTRVRKSYGMSAEAGSVGGDCAMSLCCCCCTLAQDEKEVKFREVEARRGDYGGESMKVAYQSPGGMAYPAPPK